MKKLLALMLAAALALSLVACGGNKTPTKEDLLEDAVEVDLKEYSIASVENSASVKKEYGGATCTISGYVDNIRGDVSEVQMKWYQDKAFFTEEELERIDNHKVFATSSFFVYFAEEDDLVDLHLGDLITVVGQFDEDAKHLENSYLVENSGK